MIAVVVVLEVIAERQQFADCLKRKDQKMLVVAVEQEASIGSSSSYH
jgi:hypothetical protein